MPHFSLPDFKEEEKLWRKGYKVVIGVDEVGRGAFAGPLVAGAVAFFALGSIRNFSSDILNLGINDSKLLRPNQRKILAKVIKKYCLAYGIGKVGVATINRIGIVKATAIAMRKAVASIKNKSAKCFVLVDAFHIKYLWGIGLKNQKAIIKGDQKSISIAAASIIAKVYRDSLMQELTKRYRRYHWGRNKGYGTRQHQKEILENGITTLHRKQFVQTFLRNYATIKQ